MILCSTPLQYQSFAFPVVTVTALFTKVLCHDKSLAFILLMTSTVSDHQKHIVTKDVCRVVSTRLDQCAYVVNRSCTAGWTAGLSLLY